VCVRVHVRVGSLLDILDLHAGRAAAARAHEGLRPQLGNLGAPCLERTNTGLSADAAGAHKYDISLQFVVLMENSFIGSS